MFYIQDSCIRRTSSSSFNLICRGLLDINLSQFRIGYIFRRFVWNVPLYFKTIKMQDYISMSCHSHTKYLIERGALQSCMYPVSYMYIKVIIQRPFQNSAKIKGEQISPNLHLDTIFETSLSVYAHKQSESVLKEFYLLYFVTKLKISYRIHLGRYKDQVFPILVNSFSNSKCGSTSTMTIPLEWPP